MKTVFIILAYLSVITAAAGVVLPLLPTTPFILLAAFFASRGSPAFAQWLEDHPRFGPLIGRWRTERAVPARAKALACVTMAISWAVLIVLGTSGVILAIAGLFFVGISYYLLTRPAF